MHVSQSFVLFFDSGIGGLTVLSECVRKIPTARFAYYGDNVHAPYGNRAPEDIRRLVFTAVERFADLPIGSLVLACNTATALCAESLRLRYPFPIIGAEPAVLPASRVGGEVWVLATRATCESARLNALIDRASRAYPRANVKKIPCDTLAGAIERQMLIGAHTLRVSLPVGNPSAVVLGCTHYVYLKTQIERFYRCPVFDGNEGIARRLATVLDVSAPAEPRSFPPAVTFLGESATQNKRVFEQMFAKK